jgi:hypothetical protein
MHRGHIKIYRKIFDDPLWLQGTPTQKNLMIFLISLANFKDKEWIWKGEKLTLKRGQIITSLNSLKSKLGKGATIQSIRTGLKNLEKFGFLTKESTKESTLITICNYIKYNPDENKANKESNKEVTNDQQRGNKEVTTTKNDNKDNKDNKEEKKDIDKSISKEKKKTLEERKKDFQEKINSFRKENLFQYPAEMYVVFFDYWSEHNENGLKMLFEMNKTWDLSKRLNTWFKRSFESGKYKDWPNKRNVLLAQQEEKYKQEKQQEHYEFKNMKKEKKNLDMDDIFSKIGEKQNEFGKI